MKRKKSPRDKSPQQPTPSTPPISKAELQRRISAWKARLVIRVAGPDDPIYRGGLQMTSIRREP